MAWAIDQVGTTVPTEVAVSLIQNTVSAAELPSNAVEPPPLVRAALARYFARGQTACSTDEMSTFLNDPHSDVRLAAIAGLNAALDREATHSIHQIDADLIAKQLKSDCPAVRAQAAVAMIRHHGGQADVEHFGDDPDARVRFRVAESLAEDTEGASQLLQRFQTDPHPHVRAAALTESAAVVLFENPIEETSWHVLSRAANLARVPFWKLEPESPWRPKIESPKDARELTIPAGSAEQMRRLGPAGIEVSRIGLSGHYGLPQEGFKEAIEAGINLMFWEPNYHSMTEFAAILSRRSKERIHFVAGTFEADPKRIRKDAERALRRMRIDQLALFLLFWVRSWQRIDDEVRKTLDDLQQSGQVAMVGLSTHSRPFAIEAMESGWNPLMVRHSAAHRGAEQKVLPLAAEQGTGVYHVQCHLLWPPVERRGRVTIARYADGLLSIFTGTTGCDRMLDGTSHGRAVA